MQVSDFIVKHGRKFYKSICSHCGADRGYQRQHHINRLCCKCIAQKRANSNHRFRIVNDIKEVWCSHCKEWFEDNEEHWEAHNDTTTRRTCRIKNKERQADRKAKSFDPTIICKECSCVLGHNTPTGLCRVCTNKFHGRWRKKSPPDRRAIYKERYRTDAKYRLKLQTRSLIYTALKKNNISKKEGTEKMLGCSIEEFKAYLESLFQPGMSWDNMGRAGWHIDHICPCSQAQNEEELIKLQHYTNLQPLFENDNLAKFNHRTPNGEYMCKTLLNRDWLYKKGIL
jgi:hypothetical protein